MTDRRQRLVERGLDEKIFLLNSGQAPDRAGKTSKSIAKQRQGSMSQGKKAEEAVTRGLETRLPGQ
jgi:hypothetical protein